MPTRRCWARRVPTLSFFGHLASGCVAPALNISLYLSNLSPLNPLPETFFCPFKGSEKSLFFFSPLNEPNPVPARPTRLFPLLAFAHPCVSLHPSPTTLSIPIPSPSTSRAGPFSTSGSLLPTRPGRERGRLSAVQRGHGRRLPPGSARRNAVSLQSGFSETLSNEGGGGGRIKPNPQHRLSIKLGEFTASPSDTANTGSEQLLGSPQGPDLPIPSLPQKGNGAAALGRSPREARTPLGSAFTHQHRAKPRDPWAMPRWVLRPRAGPTLGARAAGWGK